MVSVHQFARLLWLVLNEYTLHESLSVFLVHGHYYTASVLSYDLLQNMCTYCYALAFTGIINVA